MTDIHVYLGTEFVVDIKVVVRTKHITLESTAIVKSVHLVIRKGSYRLYRFVTARYGESVSHTGCTRLQNQVSPVGNGVVVGIGSIILYPILCLVGRVFLKKTAGRIIIILQLVAHLQVTGDSYHVGLFGRDFPTKFGIVLQIDFTAIVTALGSNQDNAGSSFRTVNTGCGSIFQN